MDVKPAVVTARLRALVHALATVLPLLSPVALAAQAADWAGCYDLEMGAWVPSVGSDSLPYALPPRIQLDSVLNDDTSTPSPEYRIRPAPASPPSIHDYAWWWPMGTDSIASTWTDRRQGVSVRLGREGPLLRGQAATRAHVIPYEPHTTDVLARPVDCNAPMPPAHASWRRFPRRVVVESGDTVALGELLPADGLRMELYQGYMYWLRHQPTGLFAGATDLLVSRDDDGIVRNIEAYFDPSVGVEALEVHLTSSIGPPTSRRERRERTSISWAGREGHTLSIERYTPADREERLLIRIWEP